MVMASQVQILDKVVCFHIVLIPLEKVCIQLFSFQLLANRPGFLTLVWQPVWEKEIQIF